MVEGPVKVAQSQKREIAIPRSPETMVREAFEREWEAMRATHLIRNVMYQARIYGVGAVVYGANGFDTNEPIDPWKLSELELYFNTLDPLNTAGSLVLDQNPNAPDFQKYQFVTASGQPYHRSRSCVMMNEQPIFLGYTSSAFGYVGRSVYQRALFPLKSFIQSMLTDDLVTRKAGLLVAKMKMAGSLADRLMGKAAGIKRSLLKEAETDNVISIDVEEGIESINLQNTDTAMTIARKNIIENIATAADMPAKLLNSESFAEGFGEGQEDAKAVIRYIKTLREEMQPLYDFFDNIVQYRAWNPQFYEAIQAQFPEEYGNKKYEEAFYEWRNSFEAVWPSLMEEPESELVKVDEIKLKGITEILEVLLGQIDPENKALAIQWAQDNINEMKRMFPNILTLDIDALRTYEPPAPPPEPSLGAD